ncbi:MAG: UDP-N-acetylmuramoyl-L-alanine--D-glutamate ligase [Leptotrichiaceae bacterium]|nr:UDP-N-acetylmuramoyl-L-alanine--D-glutamate ligase [Leptotrichiaceae bacterium]MBP6280461.1 UDP-N-acetylmuramoyl-L-alanine--D-glutamate ligase [Leptotrichiaceae bacterium]MBP7099946.1 UDP-N-acetylmuramoyl-L-alanine--D-glutamate ligase [Leptotrichiaceae bacterium]MBP7725309.1 UDP-N-acetylmuramoyl-L-alanine--D-glutamate ligase [Leptotrichiaceae bacterium]MBP9629085.1 UDP-N-acetylmuramoyl-L-alanine--D-glutamate ligase [Leptotrichiaceae bacterium]
MQKALVFGTGLSGLGAKELLEKKGYSVYMIDDKMGISSKDGIEILDNENIEFIVKSPGIAWTSELLVKAKEKNIKIISEIDLAYNYMDESTKIISFTGTNGKTTTATKMDELLSFTGRRTKLAGNAGFSFAKLISDEVSLDYVVLELSSYQLENNPKVHSYISGIINLTPDHLTRYSSLDDYYTTKFNIFENQTTDDFALINLDDKEFERLYETQKLKNKIKSKKIYLSKEKRGTIFVHDESIYIMKNLFEKIENHSYKDLEEISEKLISVKDLSLKGKHNLENMLFLIGAGKILNISNEKLVEFLKSTKALEHRLENFFIKDKTTFINDSKGTNVESTIKAIDSFENKIVLILGGDDKKVPNDDLVKVIKEKVDFVYLIGENAPLLEKDMEKLNYKNYKNLENLEKVLNYLKENEDFNEDKTILFSPATSSFCQFKNFEHRGNVFKELTVKIFED